MVGKKGEAKLELHELIGNFLCLSLAWLSRSAALIRSRFEQCLKISCSELETTKERKFHEKLTAHSKGFPIKASFILLSCCGTINFPTLRERSRVSRSHSGGRLVAHPINHFEREKIARGGREKSIKTSCTVSRS